MIQSLQAFQRMLNQKLRKGKRKERSNTVFDDESRRNLLPPTSSDFSLTDEIALDCEMGGLGVAQGNKSALGRATLDRGKSPNNISFLAVLSACTHVGLVEEGWNYFNSMKSLYDIEPGPDHYTCMVDLLGRAEQLDEAISLIHSLPCDARAGVWGARLDIVKLAAEELFKLDPGNVRKDEEVVRRTKRSKRLSTKTGSRSIIVIENAS